MKQKLIALILAGTAVTSFATVGASPSSVQPASPPAVAKVEIKGATTATAAQPLLIISNGKTERDPSVARLADFVGQQGAFKIVKITDIKPVARVISKSKAGDFLEFDISAEMIHFAKLKVGNELTTDVQKAGSGTLVRILSGATPVGFMASENVAVK